MRNRMLAVLAVQVFNAHAGGNHGDIGVNNNGVKFFQSVATLNMVSVEKSPIPGTTMLLQSLNYDFLPSRCFFIVRGKVSSQADIDALKPESLVSMSCTQERVLARPDPN